MLFDLKIRFKDENGYTYTWIGGESFMAVKDNQISYIDIKASESELLFAATDIKNKIQDLLQRTQAGHTHG